MSIIEVKDLTKTFHVPHEKHNTVFESLVGMFQKNEYDMFTALSDINFVVEKGECLGVIGENGSGKSTLLKILANILRPTEGSVNINGTMASFLELGVGFQADLTAKENIYVYGTIMGMRRKQIDENLDEIFEFSGLNEFRDMKLKNFSSGMHVRLAFATAIQTKPDILLMDEVLAVGDMDFQQKCLDVFRQYIKEKRTIVFVSHDLNSIRRFCNKALLLRHGEQVAYGDTNEIIDEYIYNIDTRKIKKDTNKTAEPWEKDIHKQEDKIAEIRDVKFIDQNGTQRETFKSGDPLTVEITYYSYKELNEPLVGFGIFDEKDNHCYGTSNYTNPYDIQIKKGLVKIYLHIKELPFLNGRFYTQVALAEKVPGKIYKYLDFLDKTHSFNVINGTADIGTYYVNYEWEEKGGI